MRLRYARGGIFMIARQGLAVFARRATNSRTPGAPYWASCMASTTRSNLPGSTSSGVVADSEPGSLFDGTSSSDADPGIGNRTTVPSRLINSAVGLVQTSATRCPAISSFVLNSAPYEAPKTSNLYFTVESPTRIKPRPFRAQRWDAEPECGAVASILDHPQQ